MSRYRVDFDKIGWQSPMEGLRFKAHAAGGKQLRVVEYTRDMEPHWCEKGHFGMVLKGRFEIAYENDVVTYETGDGVFIPSGSEHKHIGRVLTDMVKVIFVEDVQQTD